MLMLKTASFAILFFYLSETMRVMKKLDIEQPSSILEVPNSKFNLIEAFHG
jgi:hypothetical protein